jgi:hypothetical protein
MGIRFEMNGPTAASISARVGTFSAARLAFFSSVPTMFRVPLCV